MTINNWQVRRAAEVVLAGGVIAYPTEAVWGVGCNPFDEQATRKLLHMKRRPMEKGLILVAANREQIAPLLEHLSDEQIKLLDDTWPGPNTWLLPDPQNLFPEWVKGAHDKIAIRVSAHPLVHQLALEVGFPVVSTSANTASAAPAKSAARVRAYFGNDTDLILGGSLGEQNTPSTIRDIETGQVVRA